MKIFSFIWKCFHFLPQLYSQYTCMPIIVSEFFPKKSSILSVILCNPQFYDTYVRLKSSVLPENISTSLFNYLIILFVCLSLYLSFFLKKKSKILSVILCNPLFYHAYFRWQCSVLSENISTSLFNYILTVFVCRSLYLSIFPINLQFYQLSYVIFIFMPIIVSDCFSKINLVL